MPIIGSTAQNDTSTLGCVTYVSTQPINDSLITTVVTNDFPESHSTPSSLNVPPLTTIYTPPSQCRDRWMLETPRMTDCGHTEVPDFTVFSVDPSKSIVSDPLYRDCQLYQTATYSPGVCPDGQTIADVTAFQASASTGFRTFWQASCCRRFVSYFEIFW